jgi:uncharacterized protein
MKESTKKRIGKVFTVIRNSLFISIATLLSVLVAGSFLYYKFRLGGYEDNRLALQVSLLVCLVCIGVWRLLFRRVGKVYLAIFLSPWIYLLIYSIGLDPVYKHLMARIGNAEAQFELGGLYHVGPKLPTGYKMGYEFPKDHVEAAKWYQLAIEQGSAPAKYALGSMYYNGKRYKNIKQVIELQGHKVGVLKDDKKALDLFQGSAEKEIFESQLSLGLMYYQGVEGIGVQKDYKKAFKWFRHALVEDEYSENGNQNSLFQGHWTSHDVYNISDYSLVQRSENALGKIYEQGLVVQQDYKEAAKWYRRAARKFFLRDYCTPRNNYYRSCRAYSNYPEAQYNLGLMYANGYGVPEDNVLAYMWWSIAITNEELRYPQVCINAGIRTDCAGHYSPEEIKGVKDSMENIKILEKKMTPQQVEKALAMAMKWKRKTPDPLLP